MYFKMHIASVSKIFAWANNYIYCSGRDWQVAPWNSHNRRTEMYIIINSDLCTTIIHILELDLRHWNFFISASLIGSYWMISGNSFGAHSLVNLTPIIYYLPWVTSLTWKYIFIGFIWESNSQLYDLCFCCRPRCKPLGYHTRTWSRYNFRAI